MATIPKVLANFETSLASKISTVAATFILNTSTDDDGNTLSGTYGMTFDEGTNVEEHAVVTMIGSSGTFVTRGLSRTDAQTNIPTNQFVHDRGATVKVTNHPGLIRVVRMLDGVDGIPQKVFYANSEVFTNDNEIPSKLYIDNLISSITVGAITSLAVSKNGADPTLTVNIGAGYWTKGNELFFFAGQVGLVVTPSTTNYIFLKENNTIGVNTTGFATTNISPLAIAITSGVTITSLTDSRAYLTIASDDQLITTQYSYQDTIAVGDTLYFETVAPTGWRRALTGTQAQGTLTFAAQVTAADTCTIGTQVYTFVAVLGAAFTVLIGATKEATLFNLVSAVNDVSGEGTLYGVGTTVNTSATGAVGSPTNTAIFTSILPGITGNAIATTETFTDVGNVFNGVTLGTTTLGVIGGKKADNAFGIALDAGVAGDTEKRVQIAGIVQVANTVTAVGVQFLTDVPGKIGSAPGIYKKIIGFSGDGVTVGLGIQPRIEALSGLDITTAELNALVDGQPMTAGETLTGATTPQCVYISDGNPKQQTLSEFNINTTANIYELFAANWFGQNFTIGSTAPVLTGIKFNISEEGSAPNDMIIELYAVDGSGFPTGAILASGTFDNQKFGLSSTPTVFTATFTTPFQTTASTQYVVIFYTSAGTATTNFHLHYTTSVPAVGGTAIRSIDSGNTWINVAGDMAFGFTGYYANQTAGRVYNAKANDIVSVDFAGFATTSASAGSSVEVKTFGIVGGFTGLISGGEYYLQNNGIIGLSIGTYKIPVGVAISTTQLQIQKSITPALLAQEKCNLLEYREPYANVTLSTSAPVTFGYWTMQTSNVGNWTAGDFSVSQASATGSDEGRLNSAISFCLFQNYLEFGSRVVAVPTTAGGNVPYFLIGFSEQLINGNELDQYGLTIPWKHCLFIIDGNAGVLRASVSDGGTVTQTVIAGYSNNISHLYKITYNGRVAKFYFNNTLVASITTNLPTGMITANALVQGANDSGTATTADFSGQGIYAITSRAYTLQVQPWTNEWVTP